jgi:hypothetical protein
VATAGENHNPTCLTIQQTHPANKGFSQYFIKKLIKKNGKNLPKFLL